MAALAPMGELSIQTSHQVSMSRSTVAEYCWPPTVLGARNPRPYLVNTPKNQRSIGNRTISCTINRTTNRIRSSVRSTVFGDIANEQKIFRLGGPLSAGLSPQKTGVGRPLLKKKIKIFDVLDLFGHFRRSTLTKCLSSPCLFSKPRCLSCSGTPSM